MKQLIKCALVTLVTGAVALSAAGCKTDDTGKSVMLGEPAAAQAFDYTERNDAGFLAIKEKADSFAYKFSAAAYSDYASEENFSVAPISVFLALSLAAECAGGETRGELLSALDVEYGDLSANFSKLYRSLNAEHKSREGDLEGELKLSNSVWVNEGISCNRSCVQNLSNKYFAYSYSADFAGDNDNANRAVRSFVKDKTKGLIDKNFELSPQTVFTLINALYLRDIWNKYGDDLEFTDEIYTFTESNGNTERIKLLSGYYQSGRVREYGDYSTFFTQTLNGYKIKFILPQAGCSVGDVFTRENLAVINGLSDYGAVDDEAKKIYHTRCLFPEFRTSYDKDVSKILKTAFNVNGLFDPSSCDFSTFIGEAGNSDGPVYCDEVRHVNTLTVNKKGIEGAAVTAIMTSGAAGPGEYEDVYEVFTVDKAFGFILTDYRDTVLFSGIVNNV